MSATTLRLLEAAREIVGGSKALAECLGIAQARLSRFTDGSRPLPDALLLRTVDIILADRQSRTQSQVGEQIPQGSLREP